jgi:hypothetical protein
MLGWGKTPGRAETLEPLDLGRILHATVYKKNNQPSKSPPHMLMEPLLCSARFPAPQAPPGPRSMWDCQIHAPLGSPLLRPPTLQARWAPALPGTTGTPPHWVNCPLGPLGISSLWDHQIHALLGPPTLRPYQAPAL